MKNVPKIKKIFLLIAIIIFLTVSFLIIRNNYPIYKRKLQVIKDARHASFSYSQAGEDLIIANIFEILGIKEVRYLDIGAWEPISNSNTYIFYKKGNRGVLVEPNVFYINKIKRIRPDDIALNVAIGFNNNKESDYYMILDKYKSALNTFSKETAEMHKKRGLKVKVIKMSLLNINDVIKDNFKSPPNLISIDVEGLDLEILKTLDFDKYRPAIICVETLIVHSRKRRIETIEFMKSKGYVIRGSTFINTIFLDKKFIL